VPIATHITTTTKANDDTDRGGFPVLRQDAVAGMVAIERTAET